MTVTALYAHHSRYALACAVRGRGGVFNEVLTNISIFWGVFRLNPLIILALKC